MQMHFGGCWVAKRRGWVLGALVVYALAAAAILVLPVSFSAIVHGIADWLAGTFRLDWFGSGWVEFVANILLFVPAGFLLTLLIGRPVLGLLIAVVLSAMVELVQIVIPMREPTLRDVIANSSGALIGALAAWMLLRRSAHALDETLPQADGAVDARSAVEDLDH